MRVPPPFIATASRIAALLGATALLAACHGVPLTGDAPAAARHASAALTATGAVTPNPVLGQVQLHALSHGVRIEAEVSGLAPGSEHGFHIHETGSCADNGMAAGGHFNPTVGTHGKFEAAGGHAGDLPSLVADASGVARINVIDHALSLTAGSTGDVVGRAIVLHRDPDDFRSQPAGNSGPRIACGVISRG